jgi:hypothetical protein
MVTRSFGQVIYEVEQRIVGPLDVFEDHHRRASRSAIRSKNRRHPRKVVARPRRALLEPEQMGEPGSTTPLLGVGDPPHAGSGLRAAASLGSSSPIPARERTISESAQYVMPSP